VKVRVGIVSAILIVALCGCSSSSASGSNGSSAPRPIGATITSAERIETIYLYAERALTQSIGQLPSGAIAKVKVCVPPGARPQAVHAGDFQLVLAGGRQIAASVAAIAPQLREGTVRAGACVEGYLAWQVASDQHPTIADTRTHARWKPNCPKSTASTGPCQDSAQ